jgi:hypothetical protein
MYFVSKYLRFKNIKLAQRKSKTVFLILKLILKPCSPNIRDKDKIVFSLFSSNKFQENEVIVTIAAMRSLP